MEADAADDEADLVWVDSDDERNHFASLGRGVLRSGYSLTSAAAGDLDGGEEEGDRGMRDEDEEDVNAESHPWNDYPDSEESDSEQDRSEDEEDELIFGGRRFREASHRSGYPSRSFGGGAGGGGGGIHIGFGLGGAAAPLQGGEDGMEQDEDEEDMDDNASAGGAAGITFAQLRALDPDLDGMSEEEDLEVLPEGFGRRRQLQLRSQQAAAEMRRSGLINRDIDLEALLAAQDEMPTRGSRKDFQTLEAEFEEFSSPERGSGFHFDSGHELSSEEEDWDDPEPVYDRWS